MFVGRAQAGHVAGNDDVITLSGQTVNAFNFGATARAELECRANGNMYEEKNNGGATQIDTADDWIRPATSGGAPYRTRYTNLSGDALDGATSKAEDTWHSTATTYFWVQLDNTSSAGGTDSTFDIQIDDGAAPNLASTSYRLIADREDF